MKVGSGSENASMQESLARSARRKGPAESGPKVCADGPIRKMEEVGN